MYAYAGIEITHHRHAPLYTLTTPLLHRLGSLAPFELKFR